MKSIKEAHIYKKIYLIDLRKELQKKKKDRDQKYVKFLQNKIKKTKKYIDREIRRWEGRRKKLKKRNRRAFWRVLRILKSAFEKLTVEQKKKFQEKYSKLLTKHAKVYTVLEQEVIRMLHEQRYIRRKSFRYIVRYLSKLPKSYKKSTFIDLYDEKFKENIEDIQEDYKNHARDYLIRKQYFRYFYGYLKMSTWKQIYNLTKTKRNRTFLFLYHMETRIVVILYRLGIASSILEAKAIIKNKFIFVNNNRIAYPNFRIKGGDFISLDKSLMYFLFKNPKKKNLNIKSQKRIKYAKLHKLDDLRYFFVQESVNVPNFLMSYRLFLGMCIYTPLHSSYYLFKHIPERFFGESESGEEKFQYDKYFNQNYASKSKKKWRKLAQFEDRKVKQKKKDGPIEGYLNYLKKDKIISIWHINTIYSFFLKR